MPRFARRCVYNGIQKSSLLKTLSEEAEGGFKHVEIILSKSLLIDEEHPELVQKIIQNISSGQC